MSDIEDLDERFTALTAQIDHDERRRMRKAAAQEWSRLPRVRRRRRRWIVAFTLLAVVAAAGLVVAYRPEVVTGLRDAFSRRFPDAGGGLNLGAVPEESMPVDVAPAPVSPFEGSPAKEYAEGAEGLTTPPARATGGLSHKDLATALRRTRAMLVASNLDHRTLVGGRPTALAKLLRPQVREWFLKNLDRRKPKRGDFNTRYWVTSFAPGTAELTTDVIKVNGRTKYSAFRKDGRTGARITVSYLFVYAVHRPGRPEHTERVIAHTRGEILAYRENGELVLWPVKWNGGGVTGARCDVGDGFVHPVYDDSAPDREVAKATGAPIDPYDLDHDSSGEDCVLATRT